MLRPSGMLRWRTRRRQLDTFIIVVPRFVLGQWRWRGRVLHIKLTLVFSEPKHCIT